MAWKNSLKYEVFDVSYIKGLFHGMPTIIHFLIKYVLGHEATFSITKQLNLLALSVPEHFILNGLMFSIYLTLWQAQI